MSEVEQQVLHLAPRWFQAKDVPLRDLAHFSHKSSKKLNSKPTEWEPFSQSDSLILEQAYQQRISNPSATKVSVGNDFLYEADVLKREISPSID